MQCTQPSTFAAQFTCSTNAVSWLWHIVAGLLARTRGLDPRTVQVGTFQRKQCDLSEFGEQWIEKYLNMFIAFRKVNKIIFSSLFKWPFWHNLEYIMTTMMMISVIIIVMTDETRPGIEIVESNTAQCVTLLRLRENVTLKHVLRPYCIAHTHARSMWQLGTCGPTYWRAAVTWNNVLLLWAYTFHRRVRQKWSWPDVRHCHHCDPMGVAWLVLVCQ